ncbi:hypothetical protein ACIBH1_32535 [Nonomuraea sp. NPDC050663]|uniref:hypothetical protein n=1 Tax=Nonomuraea sp. NPDC050663 TaxID=3364370 RepID=UPI0037AC224B
MTIGQWAVEYGEDRIFEFATNRDKPMSEAVELNGPTPTDALVEQFGPAATEAIQALRSASKIYGATRARRSPEASLRPSSSQPQSHG